MTAHDRAYLTIARWPEGFDEARRVETLVGATDLEPATARLAVRRETPMIAQFVSTIDRAPILDFLGRHGIVALAPTRADLDRLPDPIAAKRLAEAIGSDGALYMVEPWHGESEGLRTRDIRLLVRGSIRASHTTIQADPNAAHDAARGYIIGGVPGALARRMADDSDRVERTTQVRSTELLDIYTNDRRRFRISTDKFNFDVLGAQRSYTGRRNLDALAARLVERSPGARFDEGFAGFHPPGDTRAQPQHTGGDGIMRSRGDLASFDFYSRWFALTYSTLLKADAPR